MTIMLFGHPLKDQVNISYFDIANTPLSICLPCICIEIHYRCSYSLSIPRMLEWGNMQERNLRLFNRICWGILPDW